MKSESLFSGPKRIVLVDTEPKRMDAFKILAQKKIKLLPQMQIRAIRSLQEVSNEACDLIILFSWTLDAPQFYQWIKGFESRWIIQNSIWIPALIISKIQMSDLPEFVEYAIKSNWYFDILHPDHIDSLPIRIANLLRIHDHLHELQRYEKELQMLQSRVDTIEKTLESTLEDDESR